jgi:hypothetical protein
MRRDAKMFQNLADISKFKVSKGSSRLRTHQYYEPFYKI